MWLQLHSDGVEENSCLLNPHLAANSLVKASYDREKPFSFTLKNKDKLNSLNMRMYTEKPTKLS